MTIKAMVHCTSNSGRCLQRLLGACRKPRLIDSNDLLWSLWRDAVILKIKLKQLPFTLLVLFSVLLAACGGTDKAKWSEEVLLHDGKKIVVKMEATRNSSGFPDSGRGSYKRYEIEFPSLNVTWREERIGGTIPKAVEVVNGVPYLVLLITGCGICEQQGYPDPSLVVWRWNGQEWEERAYRDLPSGTRLNILGDPWDRVHVDEHDAYSETHDLAGFYSLERKVKSVCSRNESCAKLGQLLSEYVRTDPTRYSPGSVCVMHCRAGR